MLPSFIPLRPFYTHTDLAQEYDIQVLDTTIAKQARAKHATKLFGVSRGAATALTWDGSPSLNKDAVSTIVAESPFHRAYPNDGEMMSYTAATIPTPHGVATLKIAGNAGAVVAELAKRYPNYSPYCGPHPIDSITRGTKPTLLIAHKGDELCTAKKY